MNRPAVLSIVLLALATAPPAPVVVSPVVRGKAVAERTFIGTVEPARTSDVGSAVEGLVVTLRVREGDAVGADQPLVELRTDELAFRIASARAELELRRAELAEMATPRPEEVSAAQARLDAARADMDYWVARRKRLAALFKEKTISEEDLQQAQQNAQRTTDLHAAAQAAFAMARQGERPEKAAQARARVAMQTQHIKLLEDQRTLHTIRAPFAGYVALRQVERGEWLTRGRSVLRIVELAEVDVVIQVAEDVIRHVRPTMTARVELPALPGQRPSGTVVAIVPQADRRARTFPVKVRLKNSLGPRGPLIKAGMFARVTLSLGGEGETLMVSKDALVLGGRQPLVYVVDGVAGGKTGTVRPVPVAVGLASGGMMQVTGELAAGLRVVVRGNERLRPGQAVRITAQISADVQPVDVPR